MFELCGDKDGQRTEYKNILVAIVGEEVEPMGAVKMPAREDDKDDFEGPPLPPKIKL